MNDLRRARWSACLALAPCAHAAQAGGSPRDAEAPTVRARRSMAWAL